MGWMIRLGIAKDGPNEPNAPQNIWYREYKSIGSDSHGLLKAGQWVVNMFQHMG
ncbi:hypothetical protein GCM10023156_30690 [Novipirellula rosea]|uniref:Uncharacterized protein n=1 Tax=Novipirellula rosea TaxID=1031540 RepID=A0ABP8MWD0_9BACT